VTLDLPLASIRLDGGTQTRATTDAAAIADYAERYREQLDMPPVVVFFDGADHWLADGFHRVAAAVLAGRGEIPTDLRDGTLQDARRHAICANQAHGVRLSNADKRRKIGMALDDPEWSTLSDRELGRRCGVDHKTVATVRRELAEPTVCPWTAIRLERGAVIARRIEIPPPADSSERAAFSHLWDLFRGRAWEHSWCQKSHVCPVFAILALADYDRIRAGDDPFDTMTPGAVALARSTAAMRDALIPALWDRLVAAGHLDRFIETEAPQDFALWGRLERIASLPIEEQRRACDLT
jgi:hypothetical protein